MTAPTAWVDAVHRRVAGTRFADGIRYRDVIGSTIDEVRVLADEGAAEGVVVLAEEQTRGRGQRGRRWFSPAGASLSLSALLRPALPATAAGALTAAAGLAALDALRALGVTAVLRRPNDLLIELSGTGWRKLAGCLVDTAVSGQAVRHAIVSFGLNVHESTLPAPLTGWATCLDLVLGRRVSRADAAAAFLVELDRRVAALDARELRRGLLAEYEASAREVHAPAERLLPAEAPSPAGLGHHRATREEEPRG